MILSEVLNGAVEEKQLDLKKTFFLQTWKSFSHAGKPGERPAHTEVNQFFSCDEALSCGVS